MLYVMEGLRIVEIRLRTMTIFPYAISIYHGRKSTPVNSKNGVRVKICESKLSGIPKCSPGGARIKYYFQHQDVMHAREKI